MRIIFITLATAIVFGSSVDANELTYEALLQRARTNSPMVLASRADLNASGFAHKAIQSEMYPVISGFYENFAGNNVRQRSQLSARQPVCTFGSYSAKRSKGQALVCEASAQG
jgi:hypothetical protein